LILLASLLKKPIDKLLLPLGCLLLLAEHGKEFGARDAIILRCGLIVADGRIGFRGGGHRIRTGLLALTRSLSRGLARFATRHLVVVMIMIRPSTGSCSQGYAPRRPS
jgi:hypothetical protein